MRQLVSARTFEEWKGWKWWPGMSMTFNGAPESVSHPAVASVTLVLSASHWGIWGTPEGLYPSLDRRSTIGGQVPPVARGSYLPSIWAFIANWAFISRPISELVLRASKLSTESISSSERGTWLMGLGESIRRRPCTRMPRMLSWRAVSYAATPPKDQPVDLIKLDPGEANGNSYLQEWRAP